MPAYSEDEERKWVLLYSADLGERFQAIALEGYPYLEVETGHHDMSLPPAVGMLCFREEYPTDWTSYHDLCVYLPEKVGDRLVLGEPVHVTADCFGISNHSGGSSFAVTTAGQTHVTYAEIPKGPKGMNPTYVATIDRQTRRVVRRTFLANAHPQVADVHSTPVITVDSQGTLHVLCGAHGNPFMYLRSLAPGGADARWTAPKEMYERQTYATLICDAQDRLHSIYRLHPRLIYQHKPASGAEWSAPATLSNPPHGHQGYSIYYHRFFIDRQDALYVSFTFYETRTGQEGRYPRALAVSEDHGQTWRLATTELLTQRRM